MTVALFCHRFSGRIRNCRNAHKIVRVSFIFTIIGLMISLDVIWWIVFARLTNHAIGRVLLSIFMVAMMVGLIAVIAARMYRGDWDRVIPKFAVSAVFIWHFIGLGLLSLIGLALIPILLGQKIVRVTRNAPIKVERSARPSDWNRREFLRFAGAMLPPVFTLSLTGIAMAQLNNIRVRRFVLQIGRAHV